MTENTKIFTGQYILLCLSSLLFFSSFNMLIPELPDYITKMGGEEYKGLIIGIFTLTAGFSRPFSGQLTDRWGRIPVMMVGAMVCVVCGFFYPLVNTVFLFLALRLVHGFSTGFKPTATAAYIADIVPTQRRGEAMGIYGFVTSLGMAMGPFVGSWIARLFDLNVLFYASSVFAFLSVAILFSMSETLLPQKREPFSLSMFKVKWKDVFYPNVWPVTVIVFTSAFAYGTVITLAPDLTKIVGLTNKGIYYLVFTLSSLLIRILAGKLSDKQGRVNVLIAGATCLIMALLSTSIAQVHFFYFGSFLFGVAWGIISPSYQAWTIDLCTEETRGRAVATMYIALEAGIGAGAVLPMLLYNNRADRIGWAFQSAAIVAVLGLAFLLWYKRKVETKWARA
ncbi:MFS transporter [Marinilongibacter aquaticus]|uniref:MFS transporter n=1 Tax=Marinilongibacter aquaticus TaxID=2975157 RepID=UPI0021BDBD71|nr:MFS transporter [Marinilongibacter aquaticus]UBM57982.1 MFS transporter [Marinilongibacter aquaticus]